MEWDNDFPIWLICMKVKVYLFVAILVVILLAGLIISIGDFSQGQSTIRVSLDKSTEVAPVQQADHSDSNQSNEDVLRVAIAGVLSPAKTLEHYQELLAFIRQKLGRQVTLILRPTYAEINDLIRGGRVDIAFGHFVFLALTFKFFDYFI